MRLQRGVGLLVAAVVATVSLTAAPPPAKAGGYDQYLVLAPTSTGGSKTVVFSHSNSFPCYTTSTSYNLYFTLNYGKVTSTTVYVKSVTYRYFVKSGWLIGGRSNLYDNYNNSATTEKEFTDFIANGAPVYSPATPGYQFTHYVNKTFKYSRTSLLVIGKIVFINGIVNPGTSCHPEDRLIVTAK